MAIYPCRREAKAAYTSKVVRQGQLKKFKICPNQHMTEVHCVMASDKKADICHDAW